MQPLYSKAAIRKRLPGERAAQNSDHRIQPPPPDPRIARDLLICEISAVFPVRPIGCGTHAQDRKAGGQDDEAHIDMRNSGRELTSADRCCGTLVTAIQGVEV